MPDKPPPQRSTDALSLVRADRLAVWQSLSLRALLVAGLLGIALLGHWLDRDGLRDNTDGSISFLDIVYFTTVTVTTVGYGDIVPVTPSARMFDSFVVTPIRLFVWLIFLGSAYRFVFAAGWQKLRTRMIARSLNGHVIMCGFGSGGSAATHELLRGGTSPDDIVVIDADPDRIEAAKQAGVIALRGDATHNATLEAARVDTARAVLISMGRDDTAALVVLSARQLNHAVPISVSARAAENEDLLRQAGAGSVINPIEIGGHLLARSSSSGNAVDYLRDLASADGRVLLRERPAVAADVGKPLRDRTTGLGVRLRRGTRDIGFWESEAASIEPGDSIVEIVPVSSAKI